MYKNSNPISLRLFFEPGDPTSICEAFMDNFNGMVLKIPRSYIYESKLLIVVLILTNKDVRNLLNCLSESNSLFLSYLHNLI